MDAATKPLLFCTRTVCAALLVALTGTALAQPSAASSRTGSSPAEAVQRSGSPSAVSAALPTTPSTVIVPEPSVAALGPAQPRSDSATPGGLRTFGSHLFRGQFAARSFTGFNPEHVLAPGDRVAIRLWGAFSLETTQTVDAQGNVFLPNIGPVRLQSVRNADLNEHVQRQVQRVFRSNVQSYASLDTAQPVKVYVTGFVRQPGLYNGLSTDSALNYLDQAGGIDAERGSYLDVQVLRGAEVRARIDLYRFLLEGKMPSVQLHDGDTILVSPRRYAVQVAGDVASEAVFELPSAEVTAEAVLALARPKASATHLSIVRSRGAERRGEYHALADASSIRLGHGDEVLVMSDKVPGTLLVRIEGAHRGPRTLVLPYGARLKDAVARIQPSAQARLDALQLYRRSVALRQKEMLAVALDRLETQALTARSATNEEAALRAREAELVQRFTQRVRSIEPRGQIVFPELAAAGEVLLEDGDTVLVPEESSQVAVHGEVMFPLAMQHDQSRTVAAYIAQAGGYTQNADTSRVLLVRRNGSVVEAARGARPEPGEELLVLPKADTKTVEIARGVTQIIYQVAIAAKVALGL